MKITSWNITNYFQSGWGGGGRHGSDLPLAKSIILTIKLSLPFDNLPQFKSINKSEFC